MSCFFITVVFPPEFFIIGFCIFYIFTFSFTNSTAFWRCSVVVGAATGQDLLFSCLTFNTEIAIVTWRFVTQTRTFFDLTYYMIRYWYILWSFFHCTLFSLKSGFASIKKNKCWIITLPVRKYVREVIYVKITTKFSKNVKLVSFSFLFWLFIQNAFSLTSL